MNKLHSLIDHLKEQEKGYMDLLKTFSKFQSINSNLYSFVSAKEAGNSSSSPLAYQKDVLDLSELNESLANQQREQRQQEREMLIANHGSYLNGLLGSPSVRDV